MRWLVLAGLFLGGTACQSQRYVDFFPYYDNGCPKPKVVLLPVRIPQDCPEELREAIEEDLRLCMMDHGALYLYNQESVANWSQKHPEEEIDGKDLSWAKSLKGADFAVIVQTVEYSPHKYACGCDMPYVVIKMRLKVVDLRCDSPRIILFELLDTCQPVLGPHRSDFCKYYLGSHRLICDKVAKRIEQIIGSVQ